MRPPVFPPLRLISYQEGTPLLGPDIDPEGWHALAPVQIEGMLFKARPVKVTCNVSIHTISSCVCHQSVLILLKKALGG